ncbi:MAG: NYN domain-containing protein [Firmicutes bacterium]|nr:NYN domain-containing protein [Bacillota bacterium]
MERIAIFIDGANMFYAQRKMGWHIDYRKVYEFYASQAQVYNAFYYTSVTNPMDPGMEGFLRALTGMGYTVRRKVVKEIVDQETGQTIRKANLDIEIVIDMLTTADLYDRAVLISGDGDFERAVEYLRGRGKRIEGLGVHAMAAYDLVNAMDRYLYLEDLRDLVEKPSPASAGPEEAPTAAGAAGGGTDDASAPGSLPGGGTAAAPARPRPVTGSAAVPRSPLPIRTNRPRIIPTQGGSLLGRHEPPPLPPQMLSAPPAQR